MRSPTQCAILLLASLLVGCQPPATSGPTSAAANLRLLSAAPNVTEICCALGLESCLVGRTRYCTYPPSVTTVPSIGALNDLNPEAMLRLAPDLVLISGTSRAITDRLSRLGLRLESIPDVSLPDVFTGIQRVGVLAHREEAATRLVAEIHTKLEAIAAKYAGTPAARVLLLTAPLAEPPGRLDAAGPGSFYDDLLRLAGHRNVLEAGVGAFPTVALEFVLRADPDVIIELAPESIPHIRGDAEALRAWAKVGLLKAVSQKRVHVLVGDKYFVLGPRIPETFEALCACIAK
jgi:iron complex transport system substrate-binding protein